MHAPKLKKSQNQFKDSNSSKREGFNNNPNNSHPQPTPTHREFQYSRRRHCIIVIIETTTVWPLPGALQFRGDGKINKNRKLRGHWRPHQNQNKQNPHANERKHAASQVRKRERERDTHTHTQPSPREERSATKVELKKTQCSEETTWGAFKAGGCYSAVARILRDTHLTSTTTCSLLLLQYSFPLRQESQQFNKPCVERSGRITGSLEHCAMKRFGGDKRWERSVKELTGRNRQSLEGRNKEGRKESRCVRDGKRRREKREGKEVVGTHNNRWSECCVEATRQTDRSIGRSITASSYVSGRGLSDRPIPPDNSEFADGNPATKWPSPTTYLIGGTKPARPRRVLGGRAGRRFWISKTGVLPGVGGRAGTRDWLDRSRKTTSVWMRRH
jgi:hypothetical protein